LKGTSRNDISEWCPQKVGTRLEGRAEEDWNMKASSSALIGLLLCGAAVHAQDRQRPAIDLKACAPGERMLPGAQAPKVPGTTGGEPLSDRLARTEGIICPPNVDPEFSAPTPHVGTMPIIPPPDTPGGDQTVRPK
jgi:hypothetical protein